MQRESVISLCLLLARNFDVQESLPKDSIFTVMDMIFHMTAEGALHVPNRFIEKIQHPKGFDCLQEEVGLA